ncbi:hypothetical protein CVT24_003411 [Panaeolus cyanescens]|uniref:Uncharacterized protein n=1 Tax=Panaeolus cyanescens TaxID=181874 RepID=A0A409Y6X1_9AGAR|nr:hypothetical protein CVT24_003411 [Panaeolus cyanescens]
MKDIVRRARSSSGAHTPADTPRKSLFSSVKLSTLLQRQDSEAAPVTDKPVILTLKLSSRTFLDSTIREDPSNEILYQAKTVDTATTLTRVNQRDDPVKIASVKWPRTLPTKVKGKGFSDGVFIQMKDEIWYGGETMLKPTPNSSSRRFYIPNYSQPLKWKQYGSVYWCTTAAVKGPVAILEPCKDISPTRLKVFETLHDKYDNRSLTSYHGVSLLLLDYLLVTSMLLITDLQDWMLLLKPADQPRPRTAQMSSQESSSSMPELSSASTNQWRKLMYGEPLFPKISSETRSRISGISSSTTPSTSAFPDTPPSAGIRLPSISSDYDQSSSTKSTPAVRTKYAASTIAGFSNDRDDAFSFNEPRSRSPPLHYRRPATSASTSRVDSSYYVSSLEPPVPPLPAQFAGSSSLGNGTSQPSTPVMSSFRSSGHSIPPPESLMPRRRSSPLVDFAQMNISENTSPAESQDSHSVARARNRLSRSDSINSSISTASRPGTSRRRPLPQPPPLPPLEASSSHTVRRIHSSHQLVVKPALPRDLTSPPRPQRSLPQTPNDVLEHSIIGTSHSQMYVNVDVAASHQPYVVKPVPDDPILRWADSINNPERDSPTSSAPQTAVYDMPPPAYNTINFSRKPEEHGPSINPEMGNNPP